MEQISYLLAAGAVGGFAITAVAGKFMIPVLHRLHFGQTIREEGPTWHNKKIIGHCIFFDLETMES